MKWLFGIFSVYENNNNYLFAFFNIRNNLYMSPPAKERNYCSSQITNCHFIQRSEAYGVGILLSRDGKTWKLLDEINDCMMNNWQLRNSAFVGYEELSRSRRVLSAAAEGRGG